MKILNLSILQVWSLRSQGDGNSAVGCQWTYSQHKKSIFAVSFMECAGLAISADSAAIHVWDPFVGSPVSQVESSGGDFGGGFLALTALPSPSPLAVAAAQDSLLHLIDCRVGGGKAVAGLKVSILGATGLVKCVRPSRDGSYVIAGHSSGYISVLDVRTGKLRNTWKVVERFGTLKVRN
jgi:WD repeat-containing protein 81